MYVLFQQPFGYINEPSNLPNAEGLLNKFYFPLNLFENPFSINPFSADIPLKLCYPEYVLKTSLFGEFSYNPITTVAARVLLLLALVLLVLCVAYCVKKLRKSYDLVLKIFVGVGVFIPVAFHLYSCATLPYACTYNYRYLAPFFIFTAIIGAKAIACFIKKNKPIAAIGLLSIAAIGFVMFM
ncbi:hypothetical protein FACS1894123_00260 [Bacteroidia bacterium]|nr:hypothetical protein FACS1894123_00260 [Bacteroidia bacterium]